MIKPIIKLLRPHQWTKNLFCFAGLFFGNSLLETEAIIAACLAFVMFSGAASSVYIMNDIQDLKRDRQHPKKRFRPLASGEVSVSLGLLLMIFLQVVSLSIGFYLGWQVLVCVLLYVVINFVYSLKLKHEPIFDVNCIALGFVLRLLSGVYAVDEMPTAWITLCTYFLSLFLGFAKRRSELFTLLKKENQHQTLETEETIPYTQFPTTSSGLLTLFYQPAIANTQRPVLSKYTLPFLDSLLQGTASMTLICYGLFATISGKNPSLIVTVPIVHYAMLHYLYLVMVNESGEEPDRILLKDWKIQFCIIVWLFSYFVIVHSKVRLFV